MRRNLLFVFLFFSVWNLFAQKIDGPANVRNKPGGMGAEVGATTSIFPFDEKSANYLKATARETIADWARDIAPYLAADAEVIASPKIYYDRVIEINLSELEPYINGPFTPDAAYPVSEFGRAVKEKGYPQKMEAGLIGSCREQK